MKRFISMLVGVSLLGFAAFARAEVSPQVLVETSVQEVMTTLKKEKDKKKIDALVNEKVLPLFDFTLITKRAAGPAWKTASDAQKKVLVEEFRELLVRIFIAKAFTNIGNRTVKFEPTKFADGDDQVTVQTSVITPGEAPFSVDYDLKKTSAGWKVVDLAIAGPRVALEIYRNQFQEPVQQGGVDGLIKFLSEKNRVAAAGSAEPIHKAEGK
jgi:phospholipid transport system substrate-binding protein